MPWWVPLRVPGSRPVDRASDLTRRTMEVPDESDVSVGWETSHRREPDGEDAGRCRRAAQEPESSSLYQTAGRPSSRTPTATANVPSAEKAALLARAPSVSSGRGKRPRRYVSRSLL